MEVFQLEMRSRLNDKLHHGLRREQQRRQDLSIVWRSDRQYNFSTNQNQSKHLSNSSKNSDSVLFYYVIFIALTVFEFKLQNLFEYFKITYFRERSRFHRNVIQQDQFRQFPQDDHIAHLYYKHASHKRSSTASSFTYALKHWRLFFIFAWTRVHHLRLQSSKSKALQLFTLSHNLQQPQKLLTIKKPLLSQKSKSYDLSSQALRSQVLILPTKLKPFDLFPSSLFFYFFQVLRCLLLRQPRSPNLSRTPSSPRLTASLTTFPFLVSRRRFVPMPFLLPHVVETEPWDIWLS